MAGIDPKYYYLTLSLLIGCTVVGLFVAYRLQRDVKEDDAPPTEKEVLGPLEKAFFSGLMTEEEFKRIGSSMAKQKDGPLPLKKGKQAAVQQPGVIEASPSTAEQEPDTEEEPQV